jgi:RHS repeat-associated protein
MSQAGTVYFYEADANGSVTSLTNPAGTMVASYVYDSFGNLTSSSGTVANPFLYTGREFDSETGLYYYRARYYDPRTKRFLSKDRLWPIGGNPYAYALNNPLLFTDPFGLCFSFDERARLFYKSLADIFFGVSKLALAPGIAAATGGLGVPLAFYSGVQGGLDTARGLNGAIFAFIDPKGAERRNKIIESASSISGWITIIKTRDTEKASFATNVEEVALTPLEMGVGNAEKAVELPSILNPAAEKGIDAEKALEKMDEAYDKGTAAYDVHKNLKEQKKAQDCNCRKE